MPETCGSASPGGPSPTRTLLVLAALLSLCAWPAGAEAFDTDAVKEALRTLDGDDLVACGLALDLLGSAEGKHVLQRVADFGATTAHRKLTLRVGDILAGKGEKTAKGEYNRLLAKYKKRHGYLARVAS